MDAYRTQGTVLPTGAKLQDHYQTCWKELLERALAGLESTEQTLERIIDRVGRAS